MLGATNLIRKEVNGMKFPGGSARTASDGSGGGAVTTGSGQGKESDPHIHTTTSFDNNYNVKDTHTTVTVDNKEYTW